MNNGFTNKLMIKESKICSISVNEIFNMNCPYCCCSSFRVPQTKCRYSTALLHPVLGSGPGGLPVCMDHSVASSNVVPSPHVGLCSAVGMRRSLCHQSHCW